MTDIASRFQSGPQTRRALELDALAAVLPIDRRDRLAGLLTDDDVETLKHLAREGMGENTLRALASDLAYLDAWATAATAVPLPWSTAEALALQLHISLDMSFSSDGLMYASPDGPCNGVSGVDPSLRKTDGDAADLLDRPADQWRWGFAVFDVVFRRFVFGGGVAFA